MSNDLAVSMDELERESAELLPNRETLCVPRCHAGNSSSLNITQADGNTSQIGLLNISLLNGDLDNLL
ncbi:MAG TPA: hypothetical protein VIZ43_29230 [Trebonia sp.]|jgi:hypothetical protein